MTQVLDGPDKDIGCQRGDAAGLRMDHHLAGVVDHRLRPLAKAVGVPDHVAGQATPRLPRPSPPNLGGGDPMDTSALRASWAAVMAANDKVPQYFYSHLFVSHPELRSMFPIQMSGQRDKFVTALGAIVSNADNLDDVTPFIEQLGRDHRRFSVVTEHYMAVGAS